MLEVWTLIILFGLTSKGEVQLFENCLKNIKDLENKGIILQIYLCCLQPYAL